jgi:N-acetylneuraminic acid mutarotase
MPTPRYGAGVGVIKGIVYVVGGNQTPDVRTNVLEAFDPATNKWSAKGPIPMPLEGIAAAAFNNILYVVGQSASASVTLAYDPATDSWSRKAGMPSGRSGVSLGVANNLIYAVGGLGGASALPQGTNEAYDPATNSWIPKASMPGPRSGSTVGVLYGILYVLGGRNETGPLATVVVYDPLLDSWTSGMSPAPIEAPAGGAADGLWVVLGTAQAGGHASVVVQTFQSPGPRYYLHRALPEPAEGEAEKASKTSP